MRALSLSLSIGSLLVAVPCPAFAESRWLESRRLESMELESLCSRVGSVRLLARMQMISSGNGRWRLLSRQELVIESAIMGASPLDPRRCYVIVRAGHAEEHERRAFEVHDFVVSVEETSVFTIGSAYELPSAVHPER